MTTRYSSRSKTRFGVPGLNSGYDGISTPNDLSIPQVGIEDVDIALFKLFDKEIPFQVKVNGSVKDVPVVFAGGEKWASFKKALRDKTGSLILPLITINRETITQSTAEDITGRGINQQTGELLIQRRLDKSDRNYQNLINKLLLKNQTNVALTPELTDIEQLETNNQVGELVDDPHILDSALMLPNYNNNIIETIAIPTPQFYTAEYVITFWTQYTQHMNDILQQMIASYLPQGQCWKLETEKGYWFVATALDGSYDADNNFDNMSQEERIIKYSFNVKVPAYIFASNISGAPIPVKRYVSVPKISFDVGVGSTGERIEQNQIDDPFLGADDPTLPTGTDSKKDIRYKAGTRLYSPSDSSISNDPALSTLPRGVKPNKYKKLLVKDKHGNVVTKYVRVINNNQHTGETVFTTDFDLAGFTITVFDD